LLNKKIHFMNETDNKKNNKILAVLFIGVLMGALDISIVGPAIPAIEKTIQTDKQQISWIFSIYILANLTGISLMARLSDLYGRRMIYIIALAIFSVGSLVVAISHSFNILLAGRAVQGFGASGIFPVASAVVGDIFPPEKRGRALGMIGAVFGIAFILGPVIAGVILKYFVWNDLFYLNLPIAALLIYLSSKLLPNERVAKVSVFDWKGITLLAVSLAAFAFGINGIRPDSFMDSLLSLRVMPYLGVSIFALISLIIAEKNSKAPVVNPRLFLVRQVRITGLIAIGTGIFQASFVFLPSMAISSFGVSTAAASFMLLPVVIATAIGSPVSGRLLDKYGSRVLVFSGLLLAALGFLAISFSSGQKIVYYAGGVLLGFGFSILSGSALRYIMLNEVPGSERASTQGIITIFVSIGQIFGSAIIGAILASFNVIMQGYRTTFIIIFFTAIVLVVFSLFLKSRESEIQFIKESAL
jgi:EmrB/QacA subfamily drug resistance transporter